MNSINLVDELKEKEKIINYLQQRYKEDTGRDVEVPQSWGSFLGVDFKDAPVGTSEMIPTSSYTIKQVSEKESFPYAVEELGLPRKAIGTTGQQKKRIGFAAQSKEKPKKTLVDINNPQHMIETINLSGFAKKRFSRASLRDLIVGISELPCLRAVILRKNGIDDSYADEIQQLMTINSRLSCLDLSRNEIGKGGAKIIANVLKTNCKNMEWIDFSVNPFCHDTPSVTGVISALKTMHRLYYIGLSVTSSASDSLMKICFSTKNVLPNISLPHSSLTSGSLGAITTALNNTNHRLVALNLEYCYLESNQIAMLAKALRVNRTLVKLNLSSNAIASEAGIFIARALENNIALHEVDLSRNDLGNRFGVALAEALEKNETLYECDLSYNKIAKRGGEALRDVLQDKNETLCSIGPVSKLYDMGIRLKEELRQRLLTNQSTFDERYSRIASTHVGDDPTDEGLASARATGNMADYPILKPLIFTNPVVDDDFAFDYWNLEKDAPDE